MSQQHTKRVCQIIKARVDHKQYHTENLIPSRDPQLKPEAEKEYKEIHAAVWPGVLAAIERSNIVDYSIHYYAPLQLLIANFKYIGTDYENDMKATANDPDTQRWWKLTDGMQESFVDGAEGSGQAAPWWQVSSLF
jgi:L-rhamnose mutarotase